jgi:hypothetical protein
MHAQFLHEGLVALETVRLHDRSTSRRDLDRFAKVLKRESLGMPKAVFYFRDVFPQEIVRHMAIVASRHVMMSRS